MHAVETAQRLSLGVALVYLGAAVGADVEGVEHHTETPLPTTKSSVYSHHECRKTFSLSIGEAQGTRTALAQEL
jgi:hypothetical protein